MRIGIVGLGFVGHAVYEGFKPFVEVVTCDIDKTRNPDTVHSSELITHFQCNVIFVCVPTPMTTTGECDTSIVKSVVRELDSVGDGTATVVIKSTVPPGTTRRLQRQFPYNRVMFNPEFLTERNAVNDFQNQTHIFIGTVPRPPAGQRIAAPVVEAYRKIFSGEVSIRVASADAVEMMKYATNAFLAMKVTFANEICDICEKLNISYDDVWTMLACDVRLGSSHWLVPGPDGKRGFGGTCFPKDLRALIEFGMKAGAEPDLLSAVWHRNAVDFRPERDWEQLKGRAVTDTEE